MVGDGLHLLADPRGRHTGLARTSVGIAQSAPEELGDFHVVDEEGRDAAAGTPGEILVRGPNVMFVYWSDQAVTQKALGPEEVQALFLGRLAGFKHPKDVVFMEALPRNAIGKALKYVLRDLVG